MNTYTRDVFLRLRQIYSKPK